MHIYASSGLWKSFIRSGWRFLVDEEKWGRFLTLETSKTIDNLRVMVCEDFGNNVNMVNIEMSYLPSDLVNSIDSPPVLITNDQQRKKEDNGEMWRWAEFRRAKQRRCRRRKWNRLFDLERRVGDDSRVLFLFFHFLVFTSYFIKVNYILKKKTKLNFYYCLFYKDNDFGFNSKRTRI